MAEIVLKVKLDSTSYQKDIAKIEQSLTKLGKSMPKIATTNIDSLRKSYANLLNTIKNTENKYPKGTFDKVAQSAKSALTQLKGLDKTQVDYDQHLQKLSGDLTIAQRDFAELRAEVDRNTSAVIKNGDSILSMAKKFVVWQAAATLVMQPLNAIRNAITSINETLVETEDRIIELKRVLPTGSVGDSEMAKQLYDLAARYGQTFENVSDIALNFARTGMSWTDTIKATEAAVLALNVAELDATQASNGMIAIMQQFGYEASDLTEIIDKLNKTADNYAVTTDKLLAALQRTGSSAKNARLELDQTIGVITALSEATGRSGENLGTAVNSLIQFSTKSQSLETFDKLSDNMAKIIEDYQHGQGTVLDIWKGLSAEIQKSSGNSESILGGLFGDEDWRTLNAELQEQLGENFATVTEIYDTASTFRKNYFIALLNNMDTVQDSINTMQGSLGYSQKENEQYLDTYTAKLNKVQAKWQYLANDERGILQIKKLVVDLGSGALQLIEWTGGLRTTFLALATVISAAFGTKILNSIGALGKSIWGLATGFKSATTAAESFNAALGLIGLAATALSILFGALSYHANQTREEIQEGLSKASEQLEDLKRDTKEATELFRNYATEIEQARNKLADTSITSDELASTQNRLISIQQDLIAGNKDYKDSLDLVNGDLTTQLNLLKEMEEKQARENVKKYLDENADAIQNAQNYLSQTSSIQFSDAHSMYNRNNALEKWLQANGFETGQYVSNDKFWTDQMGDALFNLIGGNTLFTTIYTDKKYTSDEKIELLENLFDKADEEGNEEIRGYLRAAINAIKNNQTYLDSIAILEGTKNTWNAPIEILQQFSKGELSYEEFLRKIGAITEEANVYVSKWADNLTEVSSKYEKIVSAIEEMRDANKESLDYEEKKLAVLEAEKALEDARNQATVRRFNQATGQWEWQVDEKAVKTAEENLDKARLAVEEAAYKSIIEELKKDSTSNEKILEIIAKWAEAYGTGDFSGISNDILKIIHETGKVNIGDFQHTPTYDSGGVLHGLGGIKATAKDEIVLPPEIASKILQPTSNAQFKAFCDGLGILFGSPQISPTTQIERVGGNIDNRVNNSGQVIIQDVNVGTEKRDGILDALGFAPLMSDN